MMIYLEMKCPYCGRTNRKTLGNQDHARDQKLIRCDSEVGGCDQLFVVDYRVKAEFEIREVEGFRYVQE